MLHPSHVATRKRTVWKGNPPISSPVYGHCRDGDLRTHSWWDGERWRRKVRCLTCDRVWSD